MSQNAPSTDRIASLDWLRLVAALSVVGFHYLFRGAAADGYLATGYPEAAPYALYGYLGVNLFFLISGFVIAWSAEGRSWSDFALARFARLYPAFLVCMSMTFLVLWFTMPQWGPVTARQFAANLMMFSPALGEEFVDGVYWSIILELIFYGWVTLALMLGMFDRFRLELVAAWLLLCAVNEYVLGSGAIRLLFITEYGPLFAAGILVQTIRARGPSAEAYVLLAAAFVLSTSMMGLAKEWMQAHYGVSVPLGALPLANLALFALLIGAVRAGTWFRQSRFAFAVGGLTYPLYLLHQNVGYVAIDHLVPVVGRWAAVGIVTVAMILVAWAVWRFVEPPIRRLIVRTGKPLVARLAARPLAARSA